MSANKLWNTGVDDHGTPLTGGSVDPHWRLITGPGVVNPQRVYVLSNQIAGTYFVTSDSRWVWADVLGTGDPSAPAGYVFQTQFYLEVDPSQYWIEIKGKWGVDNYGYLMIDGAPLPPGCGSGAISLPSGSISANYQGDQPIGPTGGRPHDFSISQAHRLSVSQLQLGVGWHTLEVKAWNEAGSSDFQDKDPFLGTLLNPAGLNVSALGIVKNPVPQIYTHFRH